MFCNRTKFIIHVQPTDAIMYSDGTEPVPENYIPNEWDAKRANGDVFAYILRIHTHAGRDLFRSSREAKMSGQVCFLLINALTLNLQAAHSTSLSSALVMKQTFLNFHSPILSKYLLEIC